MNYKIKYVGCNTYYQDRGLIDIIDWSNEDKFEIYLQVDTIAADEYEENDYEDKDNLVFCEYLDISNALFEILLNSINGKQINVKTFTKPTMSSISTFISRKDNVTYELIVDEANYIYIIKTFVDENSSYIEYPFKVFNYLIKGLEEAGYQKITVEYGKSNNVSLSISERVK